jgi:hypothetical protein
MLEDATDLRGKRGNPAYPFGYVELVDVILECKLHFKALRAAEHVLQNGVTVCVALSRFMIHCDVPVQVRLLLPIHHGSNVH